MNILPAVVCCLLICFSAVKSEPENITSLPEEVKKNDENNGTQYNGTTKNKELSPEYKAAMDEAIDMMANNNKNITQITAVIDKLLKYSPVPSNLTSKILMQKIEEEVKKNVTTSLKEMHGTSRMHGASRIHSASKMHGVAARKSNGLTRFSKANAVCVGTVTQLGTILGVIAAGAVASALLSRILPHIGAVLGAYFGGIIGAIILGKITFAIAKLLCPK